MGAKAPRNQSRLSRQMVREKLRDYWNGPEGEARRRLWSEREKARWNSPSPAAEARRQQYVERGRQAAKRRWAAHAELRRGANGQ